MNTQSPFQRTLALYPSPRGFGFAVLEGRGLLVAWGVAQLFSSSDREFAARLDGLIDRYRPSVVVMQDLVGTTHGKRAHARTGQALARAHVRNVATFLLSATEVRNALG